jgi:hypothetical protein
MTSLHAHIKDVAYLMGRSPETIRSDWRKRVQKGQLPPTLEGYPTPTWSRPLLERWLAGDRSSAKAGRPKAANDTPTPRSSNLRALREARRT